MSQTPPPSDATPPVPPAPHPEGAPPAFAPTSPTPPATHHQGPADGQPVYGQSTPYTGSAYASSANPTNTLAIVSLICSLAGVIVWFIAPVAGVVTGHIALSQIKRTGQQGRGMALAGVIVGYCLAGVTVLAALLYFAVLAVFLGTFGAVCSADPTACS